MMAPKRDPRVAKAVNAMKSLGINLETVKPVLKRLYNLYDKQWELIEADNYRALADAIFEDADEKSKAEKKSEMINENVEPPFKKPHRGLPEDEVSSTWGDGKSVVDLEEGKVPKSTSGIKMAESSQSVSGASKPHFCVSEASSGSKRKDPIQPSATSDEEDSSIQPTLGVLHANRGLGLVDENRNAIVLWEKQPVNNSPPQFAIPSSRVHQGSASASQYPDMRKKKKLSSLVYNHQNTFQTTYDMASSTCGQVKVSLTCNYTLQQQNFHIPSADEVINFAESNCQKFCQTNGAQFSLVKMLSDLCENYLESGIDFVHKSAINRTLPNSNRHPLISSVEYSTKKEHAEDDNGKKIISSGFGSSALRDRKRVFHKVNDITNGTEKVKISLLDEMGYEKLPHYVYCPENITYECAYIHISLARIADEDCCMNCIGNCLSCSIPCACARDTGGEFAYTPEGLLNEKFLESCNSMDMSPQNHHFFYCQDCPLERAKNVDKPEKCKGHLLRKFIKECWRKCGCNMQCGNRVVQRGITRKLQVFLKSEGKGWGLRTLEELPRGAFICEYVGEILTNIELYERNKKNRGKDKHVYPVLLDADWATEGVLKDEEALCLDATHYGNIARFINHRCFDGNLLEIPVQVETPDRHYYHLAFFTKRKVEALEELTWDYGIDFDDKNHPIEAFQCCCGSQYCRDKKRKK